MPPTMAPVAAPIAAPLPASPPIAPPTAPTAAPRAAPRTPCPPCGGGTPPGFGAVWLAQPRHSAHALWCCWGPCPLGGYAARADAEALPTPATTAAVPPPANRLTIGRIATLRRPHRAASAYRGSMPGRGRHPRAPGRVDGGHRAPRRHLRVPRANGSRHRVEHEHLRVRVAPAARRFHLDPDHLGARPVRVAAVRSPHEPVPATNGASDVVAEAEIAVHPDAEGAD